MCSDSFQLPYFLVEASEIPVEDCCALRGMLKNVIMLSSHVLVILGPFCLFCGLGPSLSWPSCL